MSNHSHEPTPVAITRNSQNSMSPPHPPPHRRPSRFVLRSCVGGADSGFVACGSEDGRLHIWSRRTGELLRCLRGHSGCINAGGGMAGRAACGGCIKRYAAAPRNNYPLPCAAVPLLQWRGTPSTPTSSPPPLTTAQCAPGWRRRRRQ